MAKNKPETTPKTSRKPKTEPATPIGNAEVTFETPLPIAIGETIANDAISTASVGATPAKPVKAAKVLPTLDEALVTAKTNDHIHRYDNVISVSELSKDGTPKRVVIRCKDPQTKQVNGEAVSVCQLTRDIAVQDLFQVECCAACADRKVRKARRNRAKVRAKAARQALKAREQR